MIHGALLFAVAANVIIVGSAAGTLAQRIAGAALTGATLLVCFRLERRNVTFARLSSFAQGIYRAKAVLRGGFALAAMAWLVPWLELQPAVVFGSALAAAVVATIWGAITRRLLGASAVHRVLLIGDGERVGRFVAEFQQEPHPAFDLVGMITETGAGLADSVTDDTTISEIVAMFDGETAQLTGVPVLGDLDDLETVLAAEAIDTVVVAVRRNRLELFARLSAWDREYTVQELPDFSERVFGRVPIDVINAAWFMHMIHPFYRPYSRALKRGADLVTAILLGLLVLPLIPLVALAVCAASRGPIFYSQTRVGERGREFRIHKFRTMCVNAEAGGAQWAQRNDPRITSIGGFMRTTRIDELPQLWNILRGQMSFVGPRPERPQFVSELEGSLPYYQRRHMVKPGLTGWAQVRLGYADSIAGSASKLGYELYYLKHQSLFLDFVICVETIRVVLMRFGSR